MLEGYVLVMLGARTLIGRKGAESAGLFSLESPYEAVVNYHADDRGNFGIVRKCVPLLGSASLKSIILRRDSVAVVPCEDLSGKEREHWSGAIRQAQELARAIRSAEAGIVVAPACLGPR